MSDRCRQQAIKLALWVMTAAWMAVIFLFSAQNGQQSSSLSGGITAWLVEILAPIQQGMGAELDRQTVEFFVRKLAHFSEYAVLGTLLAALTAAYRKPLYWHALAALVGLGYAALDEWHQSFTPGRMPALRDVMIDFSGVLAGVLVLACVQQCYIHKRVISK